MSWELQVRGDFACRGTSNEGELKVCLLTLAAVSKVEFLFLVRSNMTFCFVVCKVCVMRYQHLLTWACSLCISMERYRLFNLNCHIDSWLLLWELLTVQLNQVRRCLSNCHKFLPECFNVFLHCSRWLWMLSFHSWHLILDATVGVPCPAHANFSMRLWRVANHLWFQG